MLRYGRVVVQLLAALARPTPELQSKLQGAAQLAQRKVITEKDVVYRSDRGVEEQPADVDADAWERRLERRASERERDADGGGGGGWFGQPAPKRDADPQRQKW